MPEKIFDNITALASQICGTPIALVSLIDETRQWFKSHHGLGATETPREVSFCGHAILQDDGIFQIENSFEDPRFADNPLVTGDPRVIFYAGAPLKTSNGEKLGTLCVIDHKPHKLSQEQMLSLTTLAEQVVSLFELRLASRRLVESTRATDEAVREQKAASNLLKQSEQEALAARNYLEITLRSIGDAVIATSATAEPTIVFLNTVAEELTGWSMEDARGRRVHEVFNIINTRTRKPALDPIAKVIREGRIQGLANHTALISRSGRECVIEDSAAPICDEHGDVTGVVLVFRDVTEKIALEEKSLLLNAVIENSQDFIGIAKSDGTAFYVNPAGRKLVGLDPLEDVSRTAVIDYFVDEEKSRVANELIPMIIENGHWDGRVLFNNFANGETIPVSWNAFKIPDVESGGVAAIACVTKDLREAERRDSLVNAEQVKLANLLTQMPVGVCLLEGPEHRFTFANPRYYDLFKGHRDIIGKPVGLALPELRGSELLGILDRVYDTGNPFYGEAYPLEVADSEGILQALFLNFTYEPMRDARGVIYGISVTATDVSAFIHARKTLEEKDLRLSLALHAGNIGTWDLDPTTFDLVWSMRGAEIFGFGNQLKISHSELMNRIHPKDRQRVGEAITAALSPDGDGQYEIEYRIVWDDGQIHNIAASGQTIFDTNSAVREALTFAGTVIDTTESTNAKIEILAAKNLAETANSAKSAFLANMSHEIRSPLGSIMGFSDLLKSTDLTRADVTQYISVIDRNSHHLLRIIDDILDLAKVEAGKMLIEHIDFSLQELLADFSSLMGFRARDKGIEFKLRVPSLIPSSINSDPTRIRQILTNIVGNAIKFTDQGRVQLTVTFEGQQLTFRVSDTGAGIAREQAEKLFQAFHQADISTTRKFGGTGLGLVLTRKLSEALGGEFWLEKSTLGQGSVFVATISIDVPASASLVDSSRALDFIEKPKAVQPLTSKPLEGLRVLVVDDSSDNQMLFKMMLVKAGASIEIASDGFEGMNAALTSTYDVVLMDVQMPRMDGHQATQTLRSKGYMTPIIALTAHAMIEERERAVDSGFSDFLSKPVHRDELISMLKRYVTAE